MIVVTDLIRDVIAAASERCGMNINFLFGDWKYISNVLSIWDKAGMPGGKYPLVALFSPFDEDKTDRRYACRTTVDLLICVNTLSGYTNEQRQEHSFREVLRPVYLAFIESLRKDRRFDFYEGVVPHIYSENYRYGSRGVMSSDGKPFNDKIDGIDIKNLELKIKHEKENYCYGNRLL